MSILAPTVPTSAAAARACVDSWRLVVLALFAYGGFLFFHGLRTGDLYRTESLRAVIAAEFLRSGNWTVPVLYGEPLLTKPPGMYAAIALASLPFGHVSEATARLPSALAALATVLLFAWYFRRQLGARAGLIAGLILPSSVMWLDKAPSAEIDMLQVFWVAAALLFLCRALDAEDDPVGRASFPWWLASLLCVAGGVLTKWTAPAFFYLAAVPLLWQRGQLRRLFGWRHLLAASLGAAVCLGWAALAIHQVGWDVFHDTVSREALQRLSPTHYRQGIQYAKPGHAPTLYPWAEVLFHPVKLFAMNLPWSAYALLTLRPSFHRLWDERGRRLLVALHCWTWPNVLFWSIIPEHASRHSLPLFPGLAGLAAMTWIPWLDGRLLLADGLLRRLRLTPLRILTTFFVLWIGVKLAYVHAVVPARHAARETRAKGERIAELVPQGQTLYLFTIKDDGLLFYYGRPAQRLRAPGDLLSLAEPMYCMLDEVEWSQWQGPIPGEALLRLRDAQGAPVVLVRFHGPRSTVHDPRSTVHGEGTP